MVFKPDEVRIKRAAAGRQILTRQSKKREKKKNGKSGEKGFQQQPKLASIQSIINQVLSNNCNLEKDICPN